jgi:hypothetical protein
VCAPDTGGMENKKIAWEEKQTSHQDSPPSLPPSLPPSFPSSTYLDPAVRCCSGILKRRRGLRMFPNRRGLREGKAG